jgi:putative ABC transport system permease protein
MKYLRLIVSNLKRKKLRTLLTGLCIAVAFILFGFLAAVRVAFNQGVDVAGQDRLVVRHKVSIIQFLPEAYGDRMRRIEGVDQVMHQTWFGGIYQKPSNFFAQMPVEPELFLDMFPEYILDDDEREAFLNTRTGAIVGRVTADRFGWEVGDRIPIQATIWTKQDGSSTWEFDLVGIYEGAEKGTDTSQFFFNYDYFDESRGFAQGQVGWYTVRIGDPERAAEVASAIDREFANSPPRPRPNQKAPSSRASPVRSATSPRSSPPFSRRSSSPFCWWRATPWPRPCANGSTSSPCSRRWASPTAACWPWCWARAVCSPGWADSPASASPGC